MKQSKKSAMKQSKNLDHYAVLMYVGGPWMGDKREYWITFGGHAHCQALSGSTSGPLGHWDGHRFRTRS